jgi:RNA polymerase sigma-70 factor (ECF subfamily)
MVVDLLLAHLAEPLRGELAARPELAAALADALAAARAAWPGIAVDDGAFLAHLAEKLAEDPPAADDPPLGRLRPADLYLARACAGADPAALAAFEARYFPEVEAALRHIDLAPTLIDDAEQIVRDTLFAPRPGERPRIAEFAGRGDLRKWVRSTALRAALKLIKKEGRSLPLEDEAMEALPAPADDPELAYLKERYRAEFKAVFQAALAALSDRDRTLLRRHVLDGLTIDELAPLYGVHRATAARWVAQVRADLLSATQRGLRERLRVGETELASVMRLARSQLDVSLERFLR